MKDDRENIQVIPPSNLLGAKLGVTGTTGAEMDMDALRRAEEAVAQLQESYPEWVGPDLDRMENLLKEVGSLSGEAQANHLREIFDIAHNIKGQGVSFSYPLMTRIGESLCDFLRTKKKPDAAALRLMEAHAQAMQAIIRDRLQDEKDPLAKKVVAELRAIGARIG